MEKIDIPNYKTYGGPSFKKDEMWLNSDEMISRISEKVNEIVEWINKQDNI